MYLPDKKRDAEHIPPENDYLTGTKRVANRYSESLQNKMLSRLISMPNVIVTSHQAFLTEEALDSIARTTMENIRVFFETGVCENELCYRCGRIEECRKNRAKACF